MPKADRLSLGHMRDAARTVVGKTQQLDRAAFEADEDLRLAVIHLIRTFGEAARRVSDR